MSERSDWQHPVILTPDQDDSGVVLDCRVKPVLLAAPVAPSHAASSSSSSSSPSTPSPSRKESISRSGQPAASSRRLPSPITLFLVLVTLLLIQEIVLLIQQSFAQHWSLGVLFAGLILLLTAVLWVSAFREWRRFSALKNLFALRRELDLDRQQCQEETGSASNCTQTVITLCQHYQKQGITTHEEIEVFHNAMGEHLEHLQNREILELFSKQFLEPIDRRAYRLVTRHATSTALVTTINPLAWLDALLFLWRVTKMVREIADCYGVSPGSVGSMLLLKKVILGMAAVGASDWIADELAETAGDSIASLILAHAGQGVASGLFAARIGLHAISLCRPVSFTKEQRPNLKVIQREIVTAVKR